MLISLGNSRNWAITCRRKAMVFPKMIKGIKNGGTGFYSSENKVKKGRGVGIPPFLTPKP